MGSELIDGMVAYAWTGLGASFGPPLIAALWWRRTTFAGALTGMVGGMTAAIIWRNSPALNDLLDIKAAAVVISALLVVGVSLVTRPAAPHPGTPTAPGS
jgi:sodium/proline symporter